MIKYVLTDGNEKYIRLDKASNRYVPVRGKQYATSWEKKAVAENILSNSISKDLRSRFFVKPTEIQTVNPVGFSKKRINKSDECTAKNKLDKSSQLIDRMRKETVREDHIDEWYPEIKKITDTAVNLEERKNELSAMLSDVDLQICDIYHYIEDKNMNCCEGYKIAKALQVRLRNRRKIKNELEVITNLFNSGFSSRSLKAVQRSVENLSNKKYRPRVLPELFEN